MQKAGIAKERVGAFCAAVYADRAVVARGARLDARISGLFTAMATNRDPMVMGTALAVLNMIAKATPTLVAEVQPTISRITEGLVGMANNDADLVTANKAVELLAANVPLLNSYAHQKIKAFRHEAARGALMAMAKINASATATQQQKEEALLELWRYRPLLSEMLLIPGVPVTPVRQLINTIDGQLRGLGTTGQKLMQKVVARIVAEFQAQPGMTYNVARLLQKPPANPLARVQVPALITDVSWGGYKNRMSSLIERAFVGGEQNNLRDLLVNGRRDGGVYPDSWFDKTMRTATAGYDRATGEAAERDPRKQSVRGEVAQLIAYMESIQGDHPEEVQQALRALAEYATACADQTVVGLMKIKAKLQIAAACRGRDLSVEARIKQGLAFSLNLAKLEALQGVATYESRQAGQGVAGGAESIETYLRLCLDYRDALGLDIAASSMLYEGCATAHTFSEGLRNALGGVVDEGFLVNLVKDTPIVDQIPQTAAYKAANTALGDADDAKVAAYLVARGMETKEVFTVAHPELRADDLDSAWDDRIGAASTQYLGDLREYLLLKALYDAGYRRMAPPEPRVRPPEARAV